MKREFLDFLEDILDAMDKAEAMLPVSISKPSRRTIKSTLRWSGH